MRKLLLFLILYYSLVGFSQPGIKMINREDKEKLIAGTAFIKLKSIWDSVKTEIQYQKQNQGEETNIFKPKFIIQLHKEQRARQKKQPGYSFVLGLFYLLFT